jgi:hypothetical protein
VNGGWMPRGWGEGYGGDDFVQTDLHGQFALFKENFDNCCYQKLI